MATHSTYTMQGITHLYRRTLTCEQGEWRMQPDSRKKDAVSNSVSSHQDVKKVKAFIEVEVIYCEKQGER